MSLKRCLLSLILTLLSVTILHAEKGQRRNIKVTLSKVSSQAKSGDVGDYRGWDYLVNKLIKDGIPKSEIDAIYKDTRMPLYTTVYFKLAPRESVDIYSGFRKKMKLDSAKDFIHLNQEIFEEAEKKYKVNRYVIASIMLVESHFGNHTGNNLVINRLSRVGSIAEPNNVYKNYTKLKKETPSVTFEQVKARAHYLEEKFYPEVLAVIEIARRLEIDPLSIKGSSAGAFGIPQFLPSTFLRYGIDGNKDGRVSLFRYEDAVFSTANYLLHSGWDDTASLQEKEGVIWKYNQSEAYVDTILAIADDLEG